MRVLEKIELNFILLRSNKIYIFFQSEGVKSNHWRKISQGDLHSELTVIYIFEMKHLLVG